MERIQHNLSGIDELPDPPESVAVLLLISNCHISLCHERTKPIEI